MAQPLKIFISSPGDVSEERRRAALVISLLKREFARFFDVSAVLWEYEPMLSSGHFQDIIDPPSSADIVVLILWSRLGTPLPASTATREYKSLTGEIPVTGTEWEYEQALEARKHRSGVPDLLVYRKVTDGIATFSRAEELDGIRRQWESLQAFWQRHFEGPDGTFKAAFNRFATLDEFQSQIEQHLRELLRRRLPPQPLRIAGAKQGDRIDWWAGSPYRGLHAFDIEHAVVFFGRERAEREITEALVRRAGEGTGFMLVLGASGSGKSSLVRAGLLPDLMAPGVVSGVSTWRHVIVQPTDLVPDPFAGLAAALLRPDALPELAAIGYREGELAAQLRSDPALAAVPLRLALQRAAADDQDAAGGIRQGRLVLVLDQLEVLFTSPAFNDDLRHALGRLLAKLAQSGIVWIVATLRSDFYHRLVDVPELNALATGLGQYLLAPPNAAEIEQIIARPAEVAGLSFEAAEDTGISLAATIREAAARDPASLPLLSFVLDELYRRDIEEADGSVLTYRSYGALGRLEGAIARHADALVEQLPPEADSALSALLLTLVEVDELNGTATARTVRREGLSDPTQRALADRLVSARLAVADDAGAGQTLRLAHEALLSHWPRLARLIDEHREFLIVRRRLQADAASWERRQRDQGFLLPPGLRLAEAQDALLQRRGDLDPEIIAYAEASIAADQARVAAAQRAKEEALLRELARSKRIAAVVSGLLVLALAAGGFAWWQRGVATVALIQSEENYRLALYQATGSLQLLKDKYDAGNISTDLLQSLIGHSQEAVKHPYNENDSDDVITARIQFLNVLSLIYVTVGDSRAIPTSENENALVDRLRDKDPANTKWLKLWVIARGQLGDVLKWQCHADRAAQLAHISSEAALELLQADPDDNYLRHRLYTNYATRGDSLRSLGDLDGTDAAYQSYLADARAMAAKHPGQPRWQSSVGFATVRLGDLLLQTGKPKEAEEQYRIFLSIAARLVRESPRESNYLSAVAQGRQRLGDAYLAQGDTARAEAEYRQYLETASLLSNLDPSNFRFREIFALAHQRIGDLLLTKNEPEAALREFRAYLAIAREMLAKGHSNNGALYNAAIAHKKVGDALRAAGDLAGAQQEYYQALTLANELAATNCNNGTWQRLRPLAHQRLGATLKAQGDHAGALAHFRQCTALPIKATVWSPAALWPADVTDHCRRESEQLNGP